MARKTVEYVPMDQLRENPHNPPSRTEPSNYRTLLTSIRNDGLQYPILVSPQNEDGKFEIIDGHRRFACYGQDNREEIPVIVAEGNSSHLYAVVAGQSKALTGKDWAMVYVSGGQVPQNVTKNNLDALAQIIGNDGIRSMAEEYGLSPGVFQTARRVMKYAYDTEYDRRNPDQHGELAEKVIWWLIKRKQTSNCLSVINTAGDAELIRSAVEEDRSVKAR